MAVVGGVTLNTPALDLRLVWRRGGSEMVRGVLVCGGVEEQREDHVVSCEHTLIPVVQDASAEPGSIT